MLYNGFSKLEIDRIVAILEKHGIEYNVGVPSDLGDGKKIPRDSAVMQLDLADEELMKVPEADRMKLMDMRIHGEIESPYTEEELNNLENYVKPVTKKAKEQSKMQQWATILAVGIMLCLYLYKKLHL
jgi:hypothetical protein